MFLEFFPGKYDGKYNPHSVYIRLNAIDLISNCLYIANNKYDFSAKTTVYLKENGQIQLLRDQLQIRFTEIFDGKDFSGKFIPELINDLKEYKDEILIMLQDLISWIDKLKENELTIIETQYKFADMMSDHSDEIIYRNGKPIGKFTHNIPKDIKIICYEKCGKKGD